MAKRISVPSKQLELYIVGPRDSLKIARAQRITLATNVPTTNVMEIGNPLLVGLMQEIPATTLTFSCLDVGIKLFSVMTGTDWTAYPTAGVDISSLSAMDAVLFVKDPLIADYSKSSEGRQLQTSRFTFTYNVTGQSTEDYTLVGADKRHLKYDVQVDKFTTGTTSFTLTQTPRVLLNGNYAISVVLDGGYLTENSGTLATGQYKIVGTTLTTFDTRANQLLVIYHTLLASPNWTDVADATMPPAIAGKDVKVQISANNISRVQSVTVDGRMNEEAVKELGNRNLVGYTRNVPEITGRIDVLDTDTDLISLLMNKVVGSGEEWLEGNAIPASGVSLKIQLYSPADSTQATILKTVYIPQILVESESYADTVNKNVTQTFNWRSMTSQCIIYSGAGPTLA
jgi:hypothetical protein